MSSLGPGLPSFAVVARTLRRTTERLAQELASPQEQPPEWNEFEWSIARATSAMHGMTALLAARLRWSGPDAWQRFLSEQAAQARTRDSRIAELVANIDSALRVAKVSALGLKGTALRRLAVYLPGERPMGDVDLLGRPADRAAIDAALRSIGYAQAYITHRHIVYASRVSSRQDQAFGEHADIPLRIELHEAISESLPVDGVDITECLLREPSGYGLTSYPTLASLMRHLLLHAAGHMRPNGFRYIQMHDIALLAARLGDVEWRELLETPPASGGSWWMYPPLALTCRYYPDAVPAKLLAAFARRCPLFLRTASARWTLTDVSWTNLRISAFPGIVWARSIREAVQFARSRIFPSPEALRELHEGTTATMPQTPYVGWYRNSHLRRIFRWTFSRPPRVQTMNSIHNLLSAERSRG